MFYTSYSNNLGLFELQWMEFMKNKNYGLRCVHEFHDRQHIVKCQTICQNQMLVGGIDSIVLTATDVVFIIIIASCYQSRDVRYHLF